MYELGKQKAKSIMPMIRKASIIDRLALSGTRNDGSKRRRHGELAVFRMVGNGNRVTVYSQQAVSHNTKASRNTMTKQHRGHSN